MTDPTVAAPAAPTPAAPAPEPAAPVTEAAPAAPAAPSLPKTAAEARAALVPETPGLSVRDARAALSDPSKTIGLEPDRPRNADGTFAAEAPAEAAPTAPDAAAATAPAAPTTEAAPAEGPLPGFVRIELPDGHPLRDKGRTYLDAPNTDENYFRWAINNAIRREHLVAWESHAQRLERENIALQAQLRAVVEVSEGAIDDPAMTHMLKDLAETYGPEYAAALRRSIMADKLNPKVEEYASAAAQQAQDRRDMAIAQRFEQDAANAVRQQFPLMTPQEFQTALGTYGAYMEMTGQEMPDLQSFFQHAMPLYLRKPEVHAAMQQRQTEEQRQTAERIRQQEVERLKTEELARIEAAAEARKANPFARVPNTGRATGLPAEAGAATAKDARNALFRRGGHRP